MVEKITLKHSGAKHCCMDEYKYKNVAAGEELHDMLLLPDVTPQTS